MHFHEIFVFQTKKNTLYVTKIWWNCTNILPFMFQIELYGYNGNLPIYLDKFEEESFIVFSDLTPLSLRRNQLVPFEGDGHVSFFYLQNLNLLIRASSSHFIDIFLLFFICLQLISIMVSQIILFSYWMSWSTNSWCLLFLKLRRFIKILQWTKSTLF